MEVQESEFTELVRLSKDNEEGLTICGCGEPYDEWYPGTSKYLKEQEAVTGDDWCEAVYLTTSTGDRIKAEADNFYLLGDCSRHLIEYTDNRR
jgi:hypothetical protein